MKLLSAREKNASIGHFLRYFNRNLCSARARPYITLQVPRLGRTMLSLATVMLIAGCAPAFRTTSPAISESSNVGGGSQPASPRADVASAATESRPARPSGSSGTVVFPRQGVTIRLPDAGDFSRREQRGVWSGAIAQDRGEQIWVLHEPARRTVSVDECERRARASLSVFRHGLHPAHERSWSSPPGYGGRLGVVLLQNGGGVVEGFSVGPSRCLAVAYLVEASPGFAERLSTAFVQVLPSLALLDRTPTRSRLIE